MREASFQFSLSTRIRWILWWRVLFLAIMATSAVSIDLVFGGMVSKDIYVAILGGILSSLASWLILLANRKDKWLTRIAWTQVLIDSCIASVICYLTGGLYSAFILVYGLNILTGAILLFQSGAILSTIISVVAFVATSVWFSWSNIQSDPSAAVRLLFISSALVLVGALVALLFKNRDELVRTLSRTKKDLEGLAELQAAIVENIPAGVILCNEEDHVLYCNPLAEQILGGNLYGRKMSEIYFDEAFDLGSGEIEWSIDKSEPRLLRYQSTNLNRGQRIIVFEDVTNLRKLESEVRIKDRLASVGQFAAGLAHEIKNPLASLSGSIQLLRLGDRNESELKLMTIVERETDRLDALLKNFLDYARPSQVRVHKVDLKEMAEAVIQLLKNRDPSHQASEIELECQGDHEFIGDGDKIKQVLWNLLGNAIAASPPQSKIVLRIIDRGQVLRLEVEDQGEGIDPLHRSRIFEPFFTKKSSGTGLGLALVYQIVQGHEGHIGVESDLGKGSLFWVEFPKLGPQVHAKGSEAA